MAYLQKGILKKNLLIFPEFFEYKNEDINTVLKQIEREADVYIDWDDFIDYFRTKGVPK